VPKSLEGEQVAAGWPSWLSQVAGEAIKGWIPRHAASFEKLDKVSRSTCQLNFVLCCIAVCQSGCNPVKMVTSDAECEVDRQLELS
jgi:hypothetical protein